MMMKCVVFCALLCLIFVQAEVVPTSNNQKPKEKVDEKGDEIYLNEQGIDKSVAAFEKFFANAGASHDNIFEWVATTKEIPTTAEYGEHIIPSPMEQLEHDQFDANVHTASLAEPRTDGQGLQMPVNKRNIILDLYKGDANDPKRLFRRPLGFKTVADQCLEKRHWYYRTYDGSCNWVDDENWQVGKAWTPYQRDTPHGAEYEKVVKSEHKFVPYARPVNEPNPRTLSTTFFKNNKGIGINHTPILTGLIEFIIHDVSWSDTSPEIVKVPIPCPDVFNPEPCKEDFFSFNMTQKTRIKGDDIERTINSATSWVDGSQIYGVNATQNQRLRSGIHGKLKVQEGKGGAYPPFNPRWPKGWFDGGDQRINQDWYITAIQTLFIRDHNRIADILANRNPSWNDEQLFLTTREVVTCKMFLIALAYMKGYFIMPEMNKVQPVDDNLQLVRIAYGKSFFKINPLMQFGELGLDPTGKHPAVASDEMSVGYRFHDLIPAKVLLVDENNRTKPEVDFVKTCYNPKGFMEVGLDDVIRGAVATVLPGFHSGVQGDLMNSKINLGAPELKKPFDIAMWSILRERTRGLPTFNEYFRFWNSQDLQHTQVKIRTKFSDFTSVEEYQKKLAEIYETPDQVDLVIGLQLDEELFPGMQIPKSFVLVSLLSLYSLGISDRHGPLFNLVVCLAFPNTPQDCRTTNALQDLLWRPISLLGSPNAKLLDTFWLDEIDYQHQGVLALWRLVTRNSNVKCAPMNPLFIAHYETDYKQGNPYNPVVCTETDWKKAWKKTKM